MMNAVMATVRVALLLDRARKLLGPDLDAGDRIRTLEVPDLDLQAVHVLAQELVELQRREKERRDAVEVLRQRVSYLEDLVAASMGGGLQ